MASQDCLATAGAALKCHRQDEARPSFPQPVLTQSYRNRRREPGSANTKKKVTGFVRMCAVPLARGGRHSGKVTYDSKPPVPAPRPQRSTCERLAYDLPEGRMLEWTSLGLTLSNFPSFCLGLWHGSVCTSGAGLVAGGLGHARRAHKIGGPLRAKGAETLAPN